MHILHRLFDPFLATDTDAGANARADAPGCSYASHTYVVLLCNLLDPLDDFLISYVLAFVYECRNELVSFGAL
jgi:hypothetical protein